MGVFSWLTSLFRPRTAGIVLVDMLNVVNRNKRLGGKRLSILWKALRSRLARELEGTIALPDGKYAFYWPDRDRDVVQRWFSQAHASWEADGYTLVVHQKDDTDSQLVGAMHRLVARAVRLRHKRLRIVLVSGDGVFADEFTKLRQEYVDDIALELTVLSWPESLSTELGRVATRWKSLSRAIVRRG